MWGKLGVVSGLGVAGEVSRLGARFRWFGVYGAPRPCKEIPQYMCIDHIAIIFT